MCLVRFKQLDNHGKNGVPGHLSDVRLLCQYQAQASIDAET
jgi:hypothetical protein